MSVISNTLLQNEADRIAQQAEHIQSGVNSASLRGGGFHYERITSSNVYDVESDLLTPAHNLDTEKLVIPPNNAYSLYFADFINSLVSHVTGEGIASLDVLLANSGIDVSPLFSDVHNAVRGSQLKSINVFPPIIDMAQVDFTGSGAATVTDITSIGTGGTASNLSDVTVRTSDPPNYGATQLEVYCDTNIGANDILLDLHVTKEDGNYESQNVTVSGGSSAGDTVDVGTSSDEYIDIRAVGYAGGNSGDTVLVRTKIKRTIGL